MTRTLTDPQLRLLEALNAPEYRWYSTTTLAERTDTPFYVVQVRLGVLRRLRLVTSRLGPSSPEHSITTLGVGELTGGPR